MSDVKEKKRDWWETMVAVALPAGIALLILALLIAPFILGRSVIYYNITAYEPENPLSLRMANDMTWIEAFGTPVCCLLARLLTNELRRRLPEGKVFGAVCGFLAWFANVYLIISVLALVVMVPFRVFFYPGA